MRGRERGVGRQHGIGVVAALLDPAVRASQSMWALLEPGVEERIVARLADDLQSGRWDAEHGHLRTQDAFEGALRLVVSEAP